MAENIKGTGRRRRHASNAETHRSRPAAKGKSKKGRTKRIVTTVISSLVALVLLAMLAVCVVFQHFYGMMTISDESSSPLWQGIRSLREVVFQSCRALNTP